MDLSHHGEDIPDVTGLEARVLDHLQQQARRGLGHGLGSFQEDLIVDHMAETDPNELRPETWQQQG